MSPCATAKETATKDKVICMRALPCTRITGPASRPLMRSKRSTCTLLTGCVAFVITFFVSCENDSLQVGARLFREV